MGAAGDIEQLLASAAITLAPEGHGAFGAIPPESQRPASSQAPREPKPAYW